MFRIDRVPEQHRGKVLNALDVIEKAKTPVIEGDYIDFLFEMWNTYVYPDKQQSSSCMNCRIYVIGQFRLYTKAWRK